MFCIYRYDGDIMQVLQENVELSAGNKRLLKVHAAEVNATMKDLLLEQAHDIINEDPFIETTERADDYTTLIINVPDDFKSDIKAFCDRKEIKIRDFWVECCKRILGDDYES